MAASNGPPPARSGLEIAPPPLLGRGAGPTTVFVGEVKRSLPCRAVTVAASKPIASTHLSFAFLLTSKERFEMWARS